MVLRKTQELANPLHNIKKLLVSVKTVLILDYGQVEVCLGNSKTSTELFAKMLDGF